MYNTLHVSSFISTLSFPIYLNSDVSPNLYFINPAFPSPSASFLGLILSIKLALRGPSFAVPFVLVPVGPVFKSEDPVP
jgi:hypothetical protein